MTLFLSFSDTSQYTNFAGKSLKMKEKNIQRIWATKKDVAQHLKCSLRTIENWISQGLLVSYRFGGRVFLDLNEVDSAINNSNKGGFKK